MNFSDRWDVKPLSYLLIVTVSKNSLYNITKHKVFHGSNLCACIPL